jgi:uncharacterized protein
MISQIDELQVVIKLTERCNINCSYCYVFHKGEESYKNHSPKFRKTLHHTLVEFINQGVKELGIIKVNLTFHGGEPLLLGKKRLTEILEFFSLNIKAPALGFSIQTNAILIDEQWIELLSKYHVVVGVSIDGHKEANDEYRVDHNGKGSYDDVVRGLHLLKQAEFSGLLDHVGGLAVINPKYHGGEIYRHLVDELGFTNIDFSLPMDTHDTYELDFTASDYGRFLAEVFEQWKGEINEINVRSFIEFIQYIGNGHKWSELRDIEQVMTSCDAEPELETLHVQQICISTEGHISIDEMKPVPLNHEQYHVKSDSLKTFVNSQYNQTFLAPFNSIPYDCCGCIWKNYCKGGSVYGVFVNRFSQKQYFNNKSIMCDALRTMYSKIVQFMLEDGMDESIVEGSLSYSSDKLIQINNDLPFPSDLDLCINQNIKVTVL